MEIKEITQLAIQIGKLQKDGNYEEISRLLTDICNIHVTLEQLQTTDIAKTIYQLLKSCPVASVRKKGKDLLSKWMRLYGSHHRHTNTKEGTQTKECDATELDKGRNLHSDRRQMINNNETMLCFNIDDKEQQSDDSAYVINSPVKAKTQAGHSSYLPSEETVQTTVMCPPLNTSSTDSQDLRNKCVELLIQALNPNPTDPELTNQLAHDIETHINAIHGHNPPKYKSCIRSKVANLKNPKSPHLLQGLLAGMLTPEVFARMSSQEMASDELRRLRQGYTAAGISDHQLPQGQEGTVTTKVQCQRCEKMDCRVTQISRGTLFIPSWVKRGIADEEAMTFMTCANCGAQWYHNRWVCL